MFSFELLNHLDTFSIDTGRIDAIFQLVDKDVPKKQKGVINIAFLDDDEIQKFNKEYRKIDKTTDVLSFHYFTDFSDVSRDTVAGEIILSESRVRTQADEHHHAPEREAEVLILHGLLHILGYDHETEADYEEMWKHEERLRTHFHLKR